MVDSTVSTALFCIVSAILAVVLRQYNREQSVMASLAACAAVAGGTLLLAAPAFDEIRELLDETAAGSGYIPVIFKAAAICFITQITAEICRDSGENAIASAAELWGRGALIYMSIPVAAELIRMINGVFEGRGI